MRQTGLKKLFIVIIAVILTACAGLSDKQGEQSHHLSGEVTPGLTEREDLRIISPQGKTVKERIMEPEGYERINEEINSFAGYLRNLPLKPHGSKVLYYDGREKRRDVHEAVIDMDVGDRDLQQCADAVMRLRAEYLYKTGQYEKVHFNFTNGFNAEYIKWRQGNRISVNGNDVSWVEGAGHSEDYETFRKYLDIVFAYAGTQSLAGELKRVDVSDIQIGDVFIKGGSPGHCVIVIDMAHNRDTEEKVFLLAQSYMPAQDIHVLKNTQDKSISPWFPEDFGDVLVTPEWTFEKDQLMRFAE
ncbi:MAG: DUF4846 domain-containing protein [Bacillota bacterium]|nr:DUF4846 domain-containing protein [Bacillota bacterium]MDD3852007.1 DUF4846 domain-containing protein [Bacillota bacterium]MDD4708422.1 DUF4846 domain-containing protein [Bacillota bacterium]